MASSRLGSDLGELEVSAATAMAAVAEAVGAQKATSPTSLAQSRWAAFVPQAEEVLRERDELARSIASEGGQAAGKGEDEDEHASGSAARGPPLVIDVRDDAQWSVVRLPGSRHLPLEMFKSRRTRERAIGLVRSWVIETGAGPLLAPDGREVAPAVLTMCRRGVRSLTAAEILQEAGVPAKSAAGGLKEIKATVDSDLPSYW